MCKVFVFLYNQSVISVISINLSKFLWKLLKDNFDSDILRDLKMYKLIVLVLLLLLVLLILEPEKLKVGLLLTEVSGLCGRRSFIRLPDVHVGQELVEWIPECQKCESGGYGQFPALDRLADLRA